MEFGEEYFRRVYGDYYKKNPTYKFKAILKEIKKYKTGGKLLDIGCAHGKFIEVISNYQDNKFSLFGIDISKYSIKIAEKIVPNAKLKVRSVEKTGFKNKEFDVVTLLDVIEHVHKLDKSLKEVKRLLKDDGIVVMIIPVYDGPFGKIVWIHDKDYTHIHKKSRKFWLNKLKQYFIILDWIGIIRYKFPFLYLHYQNKLFRKISPAIMLILKKT